MFFINLKSKNNLLHARVQSTSMHQQLGFSLIELLIGLVIGLIVTLVITQVFSVFEGDKRTTMGNSDAQTNGNVALYMVTRDLQQAGFGLPASSDANSISSCPINNAFSPVTIVDGGTGSDAITIHYGDSPTGGVPTKVKDRTNEYLTVLNNIGCDTGNVAIQVNSGTCTVKQVQTLTGAYPADTTVKVQSATGLSNLGNLYCPGKWREFTYTVNETASGSGKFGLDRTIALIDGTGSNVDETPGTPQVASEVISLQAEYGIDTNSDNKIDSWVEAKGNTWAANKLTSTTRNQIKAIRIAVATRNALKEKADVTPNSCLTMYGDCTSAASVAAIADGALQIDVSHPGATTNADWKKYRYRVYEAIIPIRNVVWSDI